MLPDGVCLFARAQSDEDEDEFFTFWRDEAHDAQLVGGPHTHGLLERRGGKLDARVWVSRERSDYSIVLMAWTTPLPSSRSPDTPRTANEAGEVVALVNFTDGTQAVVKLAVP